MANPLTILEEELALTDPCIPDLGVLRLEVEVLEDDGALDHGVEDPVGHGQQHQQHQPEEGQDDPAHQATLPHPGSCILFEAM